MIAAGCSQDIAGSGGGGGLQPSPLNISNSRSSSASTNVVSSVRTSVASFTSRATRAVSISADEASVAYISLAPQTYPAGVTAVITNLRLHSQVSVPMIDGGFDPVAVQGISGDSVEIKIQSAGGTLVATLANSVPSRRPPKIVRTIPGRGKTGVPLNKNIEVIFTEPVSPASLSTSTIQLLRGAEHIAGTVEILEGVTAAVVFRPASQLLPNTDYQIVVTPGVRDLDGDAVDSVVTVPFTTGTTTEGPLATLSLIPSSAEVRVGDQFQLVVVARDAAGNLLTGHGVRWSAVDPTIVDVSTTGLVTARREGAKGVLAEVDGLFVAIMVNVSNALPQVASVTLAMDSASVAPGNALAVVAIARDSQGNLLQRRIARWSTSNQSVATVDATTADQLARTTTSAAWLDAFFAPTSALYPAAVNGLKDGVAKIVATIEGKSDTIVVTVTASASTVGLVLTSDTATLMLRETKQLSALSVNSAGGRTPIVASQVQWESSNPTVATVDANGVVVGVDAGSATITGRWNNYSATVRVTVEEVAFKTISVGGGHACALTTGGATYCWGANDFGQAGRPGVVGASFTSPPLIFKPVPTRVAEGLTFVAVTAGGRHTCGLTADGTAYCWGLGQLGALGSDSFQDSWRPVRVAGGLTFKTIEAGTYHTCGVTTDGRAYCWGVINTEGSGSAAPTGSAPSPVAIPGGISFATLSAGGAHTCGLTADGVVYCWGDNPAGQLGVGEGVVGSTTPLKVSGGLTFASISAGESHTCAVTRNGQLYCWGWNFDSQLGDGIQSTPSSVPVAVASALGFSTVAAGAPYTCAIEVGGAAYCWGDNSVGQIGLGTITSERFATPQRVVGGLSFQQMSAGWSHVCAGTAAGVWYCWGENQGGVLGIGSIVNAGSPTRVLGQR